MAAAWPPCYVAAMFPPSTLSPVSHEDPLPKSVDVVVIGAGVIGISTAWFLSERGCSVLVCEKGRVAGEQSSRNWGWIRQQGRDADELPIMIESLRAWEQLSTAVDEDIGFSRSGVLYLAATEAQLASLERWLELARTHQLDTRLLSTAEVDALVDDKPGQWLGGLYTASDGRAEPFRAVPALARALRSRGVAVREQCAVRTVESSAGRVSAVVTEQGRVDAGAVVCCGGAWSSLFLGNLGVRLPQLSVLATVARTAPAPNVFNAAGTFGEVAVRRRQDGGYTVAASNSNVHLLGADSFRFGSAFVPALRESRGYMTVRGGAGLLDRLTQQRRWRADERSPFETARVLNPAPSAAAVRRMRSGLAKRLPKLASVPIASAWAGMIDVLPDVVPVLDEVAATPGLFVATGFSGHGFGIGPGAGRVMADLVTGAPVGHRLERFRLARFSDGSRLRPGPGL